MTWILSETLAPPRMTTKAATMVGRVLRFPRAVRRLLLCRVPMVTAMACPTIHGRRPAIPATFPESRVLVASSCSPDSTTTAARPAREAAAVPQVRAEAAVVEMAYLALVEEHPANQECCLRLPVRNLV